MNRMRVAYGVLAAVLLLAGPRLHAQGVPPAAPNVPGAPSAAPGGPLAAPDLKAADDSATAAVRAVGDRLTAYYAVPEMPASTILGVTPAAIGRPITPKDFASSLIDGIDMNGHVRQGIALEASLGLFRLFRVPLATYQQSRRARFFSNLLVSFATVRVASDTQSTDLAWGVRAPLYDDGDPLAHPKYTRQLGAALLACAPATVPPGIPSGAMPGETAAQVAARNAAADAALRVARDARKAVAIACLEDAATGTGKAAADSLWNATRLILAYAGSSHLPQSVFKNRQRLEDRVWLVGAMPLSKIAGQAALARSSQLIGYVDYVHAHAVDTVATSNGTSFGGRLNVGSASVNAFGEILGEWRDHAPSGARRTTTSLSAGIEFLATAGTWISTGIGQRYSDVARADKTVLLANVHWGISSKPFLAPGPAGP